MNNHVLLIDDERMLLELVTHFLSGWDIPVITVNNGPDALNILRERHQEIGLVLLDLAIPGMDGCMIARIIRDDLGLTDLPILALTALAGVETEQKVLEAGMNAMIAKPFDGPGLLEVLSEYGLYHPAE